MALTRRQLVTAGLAAAGAPLASCYAGSPSSSGDQLTIWHYEDETSAMGRAWAKAVQLFRKEHPGVRVNLVRQVFAASKVSAKVVLSSQDVPDVMEYNKGSAATGLLSSIGLLTPLTDAVKRYGWDQILSTRSLQQLSRYDSAGTAGTGDWYGVPNYGEYILWFYNKDFFRKHGLRVPTTRDGLWELLDRIKHLGVIPVAAAAKEFPFMQTWFQYVLRDAPTDWVERYQLLRGEVDFDAPYWREGSADAQRLVIDGYTSRNITGITQEEMGVNFLGGHSPLMTSGSWWYGRLEQEAPFDWGVFAWPEQALTQGSVGNLWVVPANARNKELAYRFMDITLRPEVQDIFYRMGGLPLAGRGGGVSARTREFTETFQTYTRRNKLAFYPDFPMPGLLDELLKDAQVLANRSKSPGRVIDSLAAYYGEQRAKIEAKR